MDENRELAILEADRLMELGNIEYEVSSFNVAQSHFMKAHEIYASHKYEPGTGKSLAGLGIVCLKTGQYEQGIDLFNRALAIFDKGGIQLYRGSCLGNLGNCYVHLGQYERAVDLFTLAIEAHRHVGNDAAVGTNFGNLGNCYTSMGDHEKALELYNRSLEAHKNIGSPRAENIVLLNIASTWSHMGQQEQAVEHLTQVIATSRALGDKGHEGIGLGNLGDIYASLERYDEAEQAWITAIAILNECIPAAASAFQSSLALYRAQQGDMEAALSLLETSEPRLYNHPNEHAKFLSKKGQILKIAGDITGARAALTQARTLAAELQVSDNSEVAQAVSALGELLQEETEGSR